MSKHIFFLFIIGFLFSCQEKTGDEAVPAKMSVTIPVNEDLVIFSTPGSHKLNVYYRSAEKLTASLKIFTEDGKLISHSELKAFPGVNSWEIPIAAHYKGMVLVQFVTGIKLNSMKVML